MVGDDQVSLKNRGILVIFWKVPVVVREALRVSPLRGTSIKVVQVDRNMVVLTLGVKSHTFTTVHQLF